jgi:hypothetical protein
MDMVRHQGIRMDRTTVLAGRLAQPIEVDAAIIVVEEHSQPVVAALHDMDRQVWQEEAWLAWHRNAFLGVEL